MTIKNRVKSILQNYPEARDSDNLCEWIYLEQTGVVIDGIITKDRFMKAPAMETVRRSRQKWQEECPELRASEEVQKYRRENQEDYESYINQEETSMGEGWDKLKATAEAIRTSKLPPQKKDYGEMTGEELRAKKAFAEQWLKDNIDDPIYEAALRKYETLCRVLEAREQLVRD